jgi:hypothetical protein
MLLASSNLAAASLLYGEIVDPLEMNDSFFRLFSPHLRFPRATANDEWHEPHVQAETARAHNEHAVRVMQAFQDNHEDDACLVRKQHLHRAVTCEVSGRRYADGVL